VVSTDTTCITYFVNIGQLILKLKGENTRQNGGIITLNFFRKNYEDKSEREGTSF
jgi:hypothetical protein